QIRWRAHARDDRWAMQRGAFVDEESDELPKGSPRIPKRSVRRPPCSTLEDSLSRGDWGPRRMHAVRSFPMFAVGVVDSLIYPIIDAATTLLASAVRSLEIAVRETVA
ncbi:MAG: hypothetical protein ABIS28_16910, partial [Caldimonas sp.]